MLESLSYTFTHCIIPSIFITITIFFIMFKYFFSFTCNINNRFHFLRIIYFNPTWFKMRTYFLRESIIILIFINFISERLFHILRSKFFYKLDLFFTGLFIRSNKHLISNIKSTTHWNIYYIW